MTLNPEVLVTQVWQSLRLHNCPAEDTEVHEVMHMIGHFDKSFSTEDLVYKGSDTGSCVMDPTRFQRHRIISCITQVHNEVDQKLTATTILSDGDSTTCVSDVQSMILTR